MEIIVAIVFTTILGTALVAGFNRGLVDGSISSRNLNVSSDLHRVMESIIFDYNLLKSNGGAFWFQEFTAKIGKINAAPFELPPVYKNGSSGSFTVTCFDYMVSSAYAANEISPASAQGNIIRLIIQNNRGIKLTAIFADTGTFLG